MGFKPKYPREGDEYTAPFTLPPVGLQIRAERPREHRETTLARKAEHFVTRGFICLTAGSVIGGWLGLVWVVLGVLWLAWVIRLEMAK